MSFIRLRKFPSFLIEGFFVVGGGGGFLFFFFYRDGPCSLMLIQFAHHLFLVPSLIIVFSLSSLEVGKPAMRLAVSSIP